MYDVCCWLEGWQIMSIDTMRTAHDNLVAQGGVTGCMSECHRMAPWNAFNGFDIAWYFLAGAAGCAVVIGNTYKPQPLEYTTGIHFILQMWSHCLRIEIMSCRRESEIFVKSKIGCVQNSAIEFFSKQTFFF